MALFLSFEDFMTHCTREGNVRAQTVTESLMPEATAIASRLNLNDTERLQHSMAIVVMHCKKIEFPSLKENESEEAAILSGEFWATSSYNKQVLRFNTPTDAWNWVLKHLESRPLGWFPTTIQSINEDMKGILTDVGTFTTLTIENVVRVFYKYVSLHGDADLKFKSLVYYVCGMAKRGKASPIWIMNTLMDVRRERRIRRINLDEDVMSRVWTLYGKLFHPDDDKWSLLFENIKSECEARSLMNLATVAQSTAGYGSTVAGMIQEAMQKANNFNWALISNTSKILTLRVLHSEMKDWENDKEEFSRDPWKLFKPNAAGNSKKYLNLGYLCKKLLLVHEVQYVEKYAGLDKSPSNVIRHRIFIDRLVEDYRRSYNQQPHFF